MVRWTSTIIGGSSRITVSAPSPIWSNSSGRTATMGMVIKPMSPGGESKHNGCRSDYDRAYDRCERSMSRTRE